MKKTDVHTIERMAADAAWAIPRLQVKGMEREAHWEAQKNVKTRNGKSVELEISHKFHRNWLVFGKASKRNSGIRLVNVFNS